VTTHRQSTSAGIAAGLIIWGAAGLPGAWMSLVFLAWPALFLSLGWNFLEYGFFPPDDFKSPEAGDKTSWKSDNGQNTGIESFVAFCSQSRRDGMEMAELKLTNSDKDQHGVDLPMLHTKERMEIADAWGTPFAYFCKFGMEKTQSVVSPDDDQPMPVTAKRRADGTFHGAGKYQIVSAGKDKIFGTTDDLVWPMN